MKKRKRDEELRDLLFNDIEKLIKNSQKENLAESDYLELSNKIELFIKIDRYCLSTGNTFFKTLLVINAVLFITQLFN